MSENVRGQEGNNNQNSSQGPSGQQDQLQQRGGDAESGSGRSYDYGSDNSLQGDAAQSTGGENSGPQRRSDGEEGRADYPDANQQGQSNASTIPAQ